VIEMARRKKMTFLIVGIVLIVVAAIAGVWFYFASGLGRACNPPLPRQTITVGAAKFDVEMARTMVEQACGLSGRTGLGDNQGMLFPFGSGGSQTFWMKDMTFSLDMIWISGGKVIGATQNVPPPPPGTQLWQLQLYSSPPDTDTVLEVNAGTVARDNIQIGDVVKGM
jgi:uncharacterized membrane protein (UPF0127 family)